MAKWQKIGGLLTFQTSVLSIVREIIEKLLLNSASPSCSSY